MLLPITDSTKAKRAFIVFEELEKYLKESDWCYYHSNAGLIDILGNYRNMRAHLKNPRVLKKVAEKVKAGSLIRISLATVVNGIAVRMQIISDNGKDIYFNKKTTLEKTSPTNIARTVKNWLRGYERTIPYNGRIIGILGNRFIVDMGEFAGAWPGAKIAIKRPVTKQRHPLLKKIVGWKVLPIAEGKILHVEGNQFQGKVTHYETRRRLKLRDWVSVRKSQKAPVVSEDFFEENPYRFGKLGQFNFSLDISKGSNSSTSGDTKEIDGALIGAVIGTEIWVSRNFWVALELGKKWGIYTPKVANEGFFDSASLGRTKVKLGYRYLPLGFFYGPRVDSYIGIARYGHGIKNHGNQGFTDTVFNGLLIGAKGMVPLHETFYFSLLLDFIIAPGYQEELPSSGEPVSTSSYSIEFAGQYNLSPIKAVTGNFSILSNSAEFGNGRELTYKDVSFKTGMIFTF